MEKHVELGCLLGYYGALLTERQRALLEQHVLEDCSLAEIAEREGISRQGVRDALKRGEDQLYELEQKLGFMKRDAVLLQAVGELINLAENLPAGTPGKTALSAKAEELYDMIEE